MMPIMEEVNAMRKEAKSKEYEGFTPMFNRKMPLPPLPPVLPFAFKVDYSVSSEEEKGCDMKSYEWLDEYDSSMKTFWDQIIDTQKSFIESSRDQWQDLYDHIVEMQDNFAKSLPEQFPVLPGLPPCPVTPKYLVEQLKKFQDMSEESITEQTDNLVNFSIKSQEQTRDMADTFIDNAADFRKECAKTIDAKSEEVKAKPEKKASKAKTGKSTTSKKEPAKKEPAKKEPAKKEPAKKKAAPKVEEVKAEEEKPIEF